MTECENPQLNFNVVISGTLGQGRSCVVDITTVPGTAIGKTLLVQFVCCDAYHTKYRMVGSIKKPTLLTKVQSFVAIYHYDII